MQFLEQRDWVIQLRKIKKKAEKVEKLASSVILFEVS